MKTLLNQLGYWASAKELLEAVIESGRPRKARQIGCHSNVELVLSLCFGLLEKYTKQGEPSISVPPYLAGPTPPTLKEQATKSGSV